MSSHVGHRPSAVLPFAVFSAASSLACAAWAQTVEPPAPVLLPAGPLNAAPTAPLFPAPPTTMPGATSVAPVAPATPAADGMQPRSTGENQIGVVVQGMHSDNIALRPAGAEVSGQAFQVAPYVVGYLRTPQSRADYSVRLSGLYTHSSLNDDTLFSPEINANGDLAVAGNALRVAGGVSMFRASASPFAATPQDLSQVSGTTDLYRSFALSPYSVGQLGSTDYELRYRIAVVDPGGSFPQSTTNQVSGALMSRRVSSVPLGWFADASTARTDFEGGADFERSRASLLGRYDFGPTLRTGLGVAYHRISIVRDEDGKDHGIGPTAFVSWRPSALSQFSGSWTDTYFGSESSLRYSHRAASWLFGLNWNRALMTGNDAGLLYFDPNVLFSPLGTDDASSRSIQQMVQRSLFSGAGQVLALGQTGATFVYGRTLIASIAYQRPRWAVSFSGYELQQSPLPSVAGVPSITDLRQRGGSIVVNYRTSPIDTITLSGLYRISDSRQTDQEARLAALTLGWQFALTRRDFVTPAVRAARQSASGTGPTAEYTEHAALLTFDHRF